MILPTPYHDNTCVIVMHFLIGAKFTCLFTDNSVTVKSIDTRVVLEDPLWSGFCLLSSFTYRGSRWQLSPSCTTCESFKCDKKAQAFLPSPIQLLLLTKNFSLLLPPLFLTVALTSLSSGHPATSLPQPKRGTLPTYVPLALSSPLEKLSSPEFLSGGDQAFLCFSSPSPYCRTSIHVYWINCQIPEIIVHNNKWIINMTWVLGTSL